MKAKRSASIVSGLILAVLAILVFVLCYRVVWLGDDTFFAFNIAAEDWLARIHTLGDIFESQTYYYLNSLGRYVTHFIVQFFCGIAGQSLFSLANAVVWVAFVIMLARSARVKFQDHPWVVFVFASLAFICLRTQFSPPCQVNYIWAMTAGLLVVDLFLKPGKSSPLAVTLLVPFCFLAGWGQESISSGIAAAMWIYAVLHFRSMTLRHWLMVVAFTAGMLCLCLAPGNFTRVGNMSSLRITPYAIAYFLRATYLLAALVMVLLLTRKVSLLDIYKENAFWFNAMFFMFVFNFIAKVYCNRQLFGIEVMSMIIIVRLWRRYPLGGAKLRTIAACVLAALVILVAVDDFSNIARRTAVVNRIYELYQASPDGVVYCDIDDEEYFYRDEDAMNSVNSWSLYQLKRQWLYEGNDKPLEWRPVEVRGLIGKKLDSQVIKMGEKQNIFFLVWTKQDSTCAFKMIEDRVFGPVTAVRNEYKVKARELEDSRVGTNIINDTYYNATVWRQNGATINSVDVQLVR